MHRKRNEQPSWRFASNFRLKSKRGTLSNTGMNGKIRKQRTTSKGNETEKTGMTYTTCWQPSIFSENGIWQTLKSRIQISKQEHPPARLSGTLPSECGRFSRAPPVTGIGQMPGWSNAWAGWRTDVDKNKVDGNKNGISSDCNALSAGWANELSQVCDWTASAH